jgi:hypothetical protein
VHEERRLCYLKRLSLSKGLRRQVIMMSADGTSLETSANTQPGLPGEYLQMNGLRWTLIYRNR